LKGEGGHPRTLIAKRSVTVHSPFGRYFIDYFLLSCIVEDAATARLLGNIAGHSLSTAVMTIEDCLMAFRPDRIRSIHRS
jgi:hypothetical protein